MMEAVGASDNMAKGDDAEQAVARAAHPVSDQGHRHGWAVSLLVAFLRSLKKGCGEQESAGENRFLIKFVEKKF